MIRAIWKRVVTVLAVLAAVLGFFTLIELIRAYEVLYGLHPWVGFGYLILLGALLFACIGYYIVAVVIRPRVLLPPDREDHRRYARFLRALARRLDDNPHVSEASRAQLRQGRDTFEQAIAVAHSPDYRAQSLERFVSDSIEPCFAELGEQAEREVRRSVRDIMIGVTVSPWRAADLIVVLYRSMRMVTTVIRIYDVRPTLGAQVRILADVGRTLFAVNVLNYGSKLAENLAAGIPFVGRFVDDIAQGVGAGLFTSVAGHAAISRCSSLHPWDEKTLRAEVIDKIRDFADDLKGMVLTDLRPVLSLRLREPGAEDAPARNEALKKGLEKALDTTAATMNDFVVRPAGAVGSGMVSGSRFAAAAVGKVGRFAWQTSARTVGAVGQGVRKSGAWAARSGAAAVRAARHIRIRRRRPTDED